MANLLSNAIKKSMGKKEYLVDVSTMNPYVHEWKIRVKVIRKFTCCFPSYQTLDLILVDHKGEKIHVMMGMEFADIFSSRLKVGSWICLSSFALSRVVGTFRPTKHRFMIHWKSTTWFRDILSLGSDNYFDFEAFHDIKSGALDPSFCVDLIGKVVNVGNIYEEGPPHQDWNELFFELENINGDRLPCMLPKLFAQHFFDGWRQSVSKIVICVLRFAKLEIYGDSWRATTVHTCTEVLFNPQCYQANVMMDAFISMGDEV